MLLVFELDYNFHPYNLLEYYTLLSLLMYSVLHNIMSGKFNYKLKVVIPRKLNLSYCRALSELPGNARSCVFD